MANSAAKQLIIDAFINEVEAKSLHSVQIAKLIKQLDINRNTFYYHFTSKYDVALHVFRSDLARELTDSFPAYELVSLALDDGQKSEALPYYVHREIGARTLDFGDFFKALVRCVLARESFYRKLFDQRESEFRSLVFELYQQAVASDLEFMLGGRYLPPPTFEYFRHQYTELIYDTAAYYLRHSRDARSMLDDAVNPFWNMPYEALVYELQLHTVKRPRRDSSQERIR